MPPATLFSSLHLATRQHHCATHDCVTFTHSSTPIIRMQYSLFCIDCQIACGCRSRCNLTLDLSVIHRSIRPIVIQIAYYMEYLDCAMSKALETAAPPRSQVFVGSTDSLTDIQPCFFEFLLRNVKDSSSEWSAVCLLYSKNWWLRVSIIISGSASRRTICKSWIW